MVYKVVGYKMTFAQARQWAAKMGEVIPPDTEISWFLDDWFKRRNISHLLSAIPTDFPRGKIGEDGKIIYGKPILLIARHHLEDAEDTTIKFKLVEPTLIDKKIAARIQREAGFEDGAFCWVTVPDPWYENTDWD